MKRIIIREKPHPAMTFSVIAVFSVLLSSCASAAPPCAQVESSTRTVSGHNAFQFRRDWIDFRSDLTDFKAAATKQDAQELRVIAPKLNQSIATIKRYSPQKAGQLCEAFAISKAKFDSSLPQLEQFTQVADLSAASKLASELTDTSDQLREALPSSWFVRHRHGKHFH